MRTSALLLSVLGAVVSAAPTFPDVNLAALQTEGVNSVSEYFTLLAEKVQQSRMMSEIPVCDLSQAVLPQVTPSLPPPGEGLVLRHVAIGRGTQNYTCANSTAKPQAAGAVAVLFNASCLVATHPELAHALGKAALAFNLTEGELSTVKQTLTPSNLIISGIHYFLDGKTPFFDLDVEPLEHLGEIPSGKDAGVPAPADAPKGQKGEKAVDWLKLKSTPAATGGLREVFRVETVGGSPPATCEGLEPKFQVQYSTQYWFYGEPQ